MVAEARESNPVSPGYEPGMVIRSTRQQWWRYLHITENFLVCAQGVLSLHYIAGGFILCLMVPMVGFEPTTNAV